MKCWIQMYLVYLLGTASQWYASSPICQYYSCLQYKVYYNAIILFEKATVLWFLCSLSEGILKWCRISWCAIILLSEIKVMKCFNIQKEPEDLFLTLLLDKTLHPSHLWGDRLCPQIGSVVCGCEHVWCDGHVSPSHHAPCSPWRRSETRSSRGKRKTWSEVLVFLKVYSLFPLSDIYTCTYILISSWR